MELENIISLIEKHSPYYFIKENINLRVSFYNNKFYYADKEFEYTLTNDKNAYHVQINGVDNKLFNCSIEGIKGIDKRILINYKREYIYINDEIFILKPSNNIDD